MTSPQPTIVVTGSLAYDYLMRFPGRFKEHLHADVIDKVSLSFLVDTMTKHWGGNAGNIAYSMAKLGLRSMVMATVGRDFPDYRQWLQDNQVDTSIVRQHDEVFTASFFCNTDLENMQFSSFYTGAMALARDYTLADAAVEPDWVIISPNDPEAMSNLAAECRASGYRFIYDPSQQIVRLDGETLRQDMEGAHALIVNDYESVMMSRKTDIPVDELPDHFAIFVITHGAEGSTIFHDGEKISVPAFPIDQVLDPTGAGDAYRSGFMAGLAHDLSLRTCGLMGSLCASYALEQVGTQSHDYDLGSFTARFREHFDDAGELDRLSQLVATADAATQV